LEFHSELAGRTPVIPSLTATATDRELVATSPFDNTHMTGGGSRRDGDACSGDATTVTVCLSAPPRQICSVCSAVQQTNWPSLLMLLLVPCGSKVATLRTGVVCGPHACLHVPSDAFHRRTVPSSPHDIISTELTTTTHRTLPP